MVLILLLLLERSLLLERKETAAVGPQLSVGEETAEEANVVFVMHDEAQECHAFCPELSKAGNDD